MRGADDIEEIPGEKNDSSAEGSSSLWTYIGALGVDLRLSVDAHELMAKYASERRLDAGLARDLFSALVKEDE
jgi:hypothetical protein